MFRENHWIDLPSDILKSIMKRLFYADLLNFRAVCKPWNSITRGGGGEGTVPLKQSPWLVIFDEIVASTSSTTTSSSSLNNNALYGRNLNNNALYGRNWKRTSTTTAACSCKLFDPVYKKTYIIDTNNIGINLFLIQRVHTSKHGWLLLEASSEHFGWGCMLLFAYTPFSSVNNFIELPIMPSGGVFLATFTSNPNEDQNCLFIILHDPNGQTVKISSHRRGEKSWCKRYLKYPAWFSPTDLSYRVCDIDCGRWLYSEGNIYNIFRFGSSMKLETILIMKWDLMQSRHGDDEDGVLHCSVVMNKKLDEVDDGDDSDLLSKLENDHFRKQGFVYHPFTTAGTEYESSCHTEKTSKIIKIDPPSSLI